MQCNHKWCLVNAKEDVKKVEKVMIAVYRSKWVCSECGEPRLLEFVND